MYWVPDIGIRYCISYTGVWYTYVYHIAGSGMLLYGCGIQWYTIYMHMHVCSMYVYTYAYAYAYVCMYLL